MERVVNIVWYQCFVSFEYVGKLSTYESCIYVFLSRDVIEYKGAYVKSINHWCALIFYATYSKFVTLCTKVNFQFEMFCTSLPI